MEHGLIKRIKYKVEWGGLYVKKNNFQLIGATILGAILFEKMLFTLFRILAADNVFLKSGIRSIFFETNRLNDNKIEIKLKYWLQTNIFFF